MKKNERIFIAGHHGLVGSVLVPYLKNKGYIQLITAPRSTLDLTNQAQVFSFFQDSQIDVVYMLAGKVGGIYANNAYPTEFLYENLMMGANVISAAARYGVKKLLYLSCSCVYPCQARQPMQPESLLSGLFEKTNEAYSLAKISNMKLCEYFSRQHGRQFISVIASNLYGPGDSFDPEDSHVIAGLMRKFYDARMQKKSVVEIWGTGQAVRDFLFVEDCVDALYLLMQSYDKPYPINVGSAEPVSIQELATTLREVTQFDGDLVFDRTKPDGAPRKVLETSEIKTMGWRPKTKLKEGLEITYSWAVNHGVLASAG